ncbi:unnamed protein product [Caenorhabditis bovis]|uniref:SXP/RAL-2 family protein Ani s 5-like cation-binding domain-containing protein n=1 Tax=Caenorhabditis bovis TaxID=2654633 RepID=A0A8S1FAQ1_9PELO|nr:unnamed protein product [Caenorhabditis bovis]
MIAYNQLAILSLFICFASISPQEQPVPFLENVTEEARQEYMKIVSNENLKISDIEAQSAKWAQDNGVADLYNEAHKSIAAIEEEAKTNTTRMIYRLPVVYSALVAIYENKQQTPAEMSKEVEQLTKQNPREMSAIMELTKPLNTTVEAN